MSRSTPGSLIKPATCWRSSAGVCRRGGLLCLSLLILISVHPFAVTRDCAARSRPCAGSPSSATAPDAVRERMTGLLRENIGRVLTLSPPESLTTAAAREALRIADPSQTLFLVTDGATLERLDGHERVARHGSASASSWSIRESGAARSTCSRGRARPTVASQRLGALGGSRITRRPQPGSGGCAAPRLCQRHL